MPESPDEGARRLYLVRHGQTALNAEGRLRGLANPPLDAVGIAEAEAVATALADRGIAFVYSSPLERAGRTARIIAAASGATAIIDDRFNDRDYGPWTGAVRADVIEEWGSVDLAPGVEPLSRVLARARPALDQVLDEHPDAVVAVVTHDAVIRPLIESIDPDIGALTMPTGSWCELVRAAGTWSVGRTPR